MSTVSTLARLASLSLIQGISTARSRPAESNLFHASRVKREMRERIEGDLRGFDVEIQALELERLVVGVAKLRRGGCR